MRKYVKGIICGTMVLALSVPAVTLPNTTTVENVYAAEAAVPLTGQATKDIVAQGKCGDNVMYAYDAASKTLTISGSGEMWDDIKLPKAVAETENLVIEKGVTTIGANSFSKNIDSLFNVQISDTVTTIKEGAFTIIRGTVEIPAGVTKVEAYAFVNTDRIIIKGDLKGYDYAALGHDVDEIVLHGSAEDLGKATTKTRDAVITIAKGNDKCTVKNYCLMSKDGKVVYYGLRSGISMTIPDTVEKISDAAFYNTYLIKVDLGDMLKEVGEKAFWNTDIDKVKFPKSLKKIGDYAFYKSKFANIKLNGKVNIGVGVFDKDMTIENKAGIRKSSTSIVNSEVKKNKYNISFAKVDGATGYQIQIKAGKKTYKYDTTSNKYKKKVSKKVKDYYKSVEDFYESDQSLAITVTVRPYKVVKGKRVYGKKSSKAVLTWK